MKKNFVRANVIAYLLLASVAGFVFTGCGSDGASAGNGNYSPSPMYVIEDIYEPENTSGSENDAVSSDAAATDTASGGGNSLWSKWMAQHYTAATDTASGSENIPASDDVFSNDVIALVQDDAVPEDAADTDAANTADTANTANTADAAGTDSANTADTADTVDAADTDAADTADTVVRPSDMPQDPADKFGTIDNIAYVSRLSASCETSAYRDVVYVDGDGNPYDIEWDYGRTYERYVDACDWSLVFDAEYYKKAFPMLALQYDYDDAWLLRHFQTVGIHEGRQGRESFNVVSYGRNTGKDLISAFDDNYAGYYFYYMLHYDEEKNVDTRTNGNLNQYRLIVTAYQLAEYEGVCGIREAEGVQKVFMNSEYNAFACWRARQSVLAGYDAHKWFELNRDSCWDNVFPMFDKELKSYSENNISHYAKGKGFCSSPCDYTSYNNSPGHRATMIREKYNGIGVSHYYAGKPVEGGDLDYDDYKYFALTYDCYFTFDSAD